MAVIKYKDPADGQWKTLPPGGIGQADADLRYVKKSAFTNNANSGIHWMVLGV